MRWSMVLALWLLPSAAFADGGFAEVRAHVFAGVDGEPVQVVERVRPELKTTLHERLKLNVTVGAALSQGRSMQKEVKRTITQSDLGPLLDQAGCEWPQEQNKFLQITSAEDYLSVQRLFLDIYLPQADLRIGRQAVQWGSAMLVNPTDPFPEVLLVDPWRFRRGVNALRATVPIGEDHDIQMVLGMNDALDAARVAARGRVNIGLADISLVGAYRQESENGIVGLDVRGTAVVGYWLEGSLRLGDGEVTEEIAVGLDYSFPILEQLLIRAQYYRNGAGKKKQDATSALGGIGQSIELPICTLGTLPLLEDGGKSDPFAPFFRGRDYGMLMLSQGITQDLSSSAIWLQNLGDGSALVVPTITWLANDWLELALAAQVPVSTWGKGGELRPKKEDLVFSEETPAGRLEVDMSGLSPTATLILWTRANF